MISMSGQHFINNRWSNAGAEQFFSHNPSTDLANSWLFFQATSDDAVQALTSAQTAFCYYRQTTPAQRATFLDAIATEIENLGSQLVDTAMNETALPKQRIEGERGRTCGQLRLFAANLRQPIHPVFIDHAQPQRQPLPKADSRLVQIPLGPVVVFGASNFPLAFSTAGGDTASALAAGCPVIVKGHPAHPATTELVTHAIARAIDACDMPAGVFNMLQSSSNDIAKQLVQAPQTQAVGFTGSQKVGDILTRHIDQRPIRIPFFGELGSTNPQFILNELLAQQPQQLAQNQVASMLMGHGQFCTSPGIVVVEKSQGINQFIDALAAAVVDAPMGTMLTRGICQTYQAQTTQLANKPHLDLIGQGQLGQNDCQSSAMLYQVSAANFIADESLQDEIFGPCSLLVVCEDSEELQQISDSLNGQLTASIHGTEQEIIARPQLIDSLSQRVGRLIFNQMPTGVEVCHSMQHGGPYPASTAPQTTSVGSQAILRFTRPLNLQNIPPALQPESTQTTSATPQVIVT